MPTIDPAKLEIAKMVLTHMADDFELIAKACDYHNKPSTDERAAAYRVAANNCREALDGRYGYSLDLLDKLAK